MSESVIWKFPIEIIDEQKITVPDGARFLHAGLDPTGLPCVWAMVDPDVHRRGSYEATVWVCGTGEPIRWMEPGPLFHLGSFNQGPFVWHVFVDGR